MKHQNNNNYHHINYHKHNQIISVEIGQNVNKKKIDRRMKPRNNFLLIKKINISCWVDPNLFVMHGMQNTDSQNNLLTTTTVFESIKYKLRRGASQNYKYIADSNLFV